MIKFKMLVLDFSNLVSISSPELSFHKTTT